MHISTQIYLDVLPIDISAHIDYTVITVKITDRRKPERNIT
jgi:hypothetical protein